MFVSRSAMAFLVAHSFYNFVIALCSTYMPSILSRTLLLFTLKCTKNRKRKNANRNPVAQTTVRTLKTHKE
uniref:Uncharacterized protein n=1 Tax=Anopheles darlingi TaxID=43151 RepID=A0A2M4D2F8_ANODA